MNKYILNLAGALAVVAVIVVAFVFWLDSYTRHDETTPAPDLNGMDASLAIQTIEAMGYKWTIIDSSRYEQGKRPRAVLAQDPPALTAVKQGRRFYLKINRSSWEDAVVPPVDFENDKVDNVARRLEASGFTVGQVIYQPHMGRDVVLGLSSEGHDVQPGDKLPKTTVIDLIAGEGNIPAHIEDTLAVDDF